MSDMPPISGKVGLDTTEFKTALSEMNRDIRVIESAFKASVAGLEDWGKSASGLETRIKSLNEEIEIQKRKVEALQGEYERVAREQGSGSRAAEELAIKLNKEVEALGKMQKELNQSETELRQLDDSSREAAGGLDHLEDETGGTINALEKLKSVANGLKKGLEVGVAALGGLAVAAGAAGAAVGKMVLDASEAAGELVDTSLKTGITTERLQELAYVGEQVGTGADTMTQAMARLTRSMGSAQEQAEKFREQAAEAANTTVELGEKAAVFEQLGIQVGEFEDQSGQLRNANNVFQETVQALAAVQNETERNALSLEIFGKTFDQVIAQGFDDKRVSQFTKTMAGAQDEFLKFEDELFAQQQAAANVDMGPMQIAFSKLGISITDANGALRDSEDVFSDALTALGNVANETERDAIAMEIFGKSAQELNPLIKAGAEEIARLSQEAHQVGAVMEEDTVAGLEAFGDTLASLQAGIKGTLGQLAGAFVPTFQSLADTAQTYLGRFSDIVRGADGDLVKMAQGVGDLIGDIANDIATRAPEFLQAGLNIIQGILNAITDNLPKLLEGAVKIIESLVDFIAQNLPMIIQTGVQILLTLVDAIVENLPTLVEAGIKAIIALIEGLAEAMPRLVPAIVEAIVLITRILIDNLPLLVEAGGKLLIGIVEGLIEALPILIEAMPELVDAMVEALILLLPLLAKIGFELLKAIVKGIIENLPEIGEAIVKLGLVLSEIPGKLAKTVLQIGKDIVMGVWQGIKDNAQAFFDNVFGFFQNMAQVARNSIEERSPSAVFADIGKNAGLGYIQGLQKALQDGQRSIGQAFLATSQPAFAGAMAGGVSNVTNITYQFDLNANYPMQSNGTLAADVRLLQMLYGEA